MPVKLLVLSDDPSASSGLARITRDLVTRIHSDLSDVFEVATVGYGGAGSRRFPWMSYHLHSLDNWVPQELPDIWADFVGSDEGIWFSIWDLSRFWWVNSKQAPAHIRHWLDNAKMRKWLYHPVDAEGPNGKLSYGLSAIMQRFDRVLDYSAFSCRVTGNTEHLPHGIDTSVFKPQKKMQAKRKFRSLGFDKLKDDSFLVGVVATNQSRKDWALAFETCSILLARGLDVKLWCHTDATERFWSLPNMVEDFGMRDRVCITNGRFTDEQMAEFYSACDVTLGIGLGEGFGFPIFESLACGTPCIHGEYGGAAEYLPESMKVELNADPHEWPPTRYEGIYCCKRPVFNAGNWAEKITDGDYSTVTGMRYFLKAHLAQDASLPPELDWTNLWPRWKEWLLKGIE